MSLVERCSGKPSLVLGSSRAILGAAIAPAEAVLRLATRPALTLSDMDAEIASLEQRRDKTRALKQGMMQQFLTGRIRLISHRGDADA